MAAEEKPNDILTLFKRSNNTLIKKEQEPQNTPKIIYDTGFVTDDAVLKSIMNQFVKNKKHIEAVKKIDEGNYTKEYFEENKEDDLFKFKVSLHQEQEPLFENKIYLDKKTDPYGIPLINLNWRMSDKLKQTARESLIALGKFLVDKNIGRLSIDQYIFEEKFKSIFAGAHQMGGTRMGTNYDNSVVDKNLKVHSIKNLFVTGSSVFATSGHGHPTYTIICLSLRLGEHIKKILL